MAGDGSTVIIKALQSAGRGFECLYLKSLANVDRFACFGSCVSDDGGTAVEASTRISKA